jgi:hypothetical protein
MRLVLAFPLISLAGTAVAQSKPPNPPTAAAAQMRLEPLHYKGVHDLHRGPDGQWTGKATQNGVEKNVTVHPDGSVTAR